ncbi:hypothetical protein EV424DRAFT_1345572 [Suillus variegatus]|nr:hypothetical protein EV424DRAFT_1345572 [Suillus variegatus]
MRIRTDKPNGHGMDGRRMSDRTEDARPKRSCVRVADKVLKCTGSLQAHRDISLYNTPRPAHPPIQMSRRNKCLLALMVENRHKVVIRLWQELNEMEVLLGLEHI